MLSVADGVSLPTLKFTLSAGIALDGGSPVDDTSGDPDTRTWTFTIDPGTDASDVSDFVSSFAVERGDSKSTDDIGVTITTTMAEAATEAGPNGASGVEANEADNVDVDTYRFTIDYLDPPEGAILVAGRMSQSTGDIPSILTFAAC